MRSLHTVWNDFSSQVQAPNPNADVIHTSADLLHRPGGTERYVAVADGGSHQKGAAYLPPGQIATWGRGIALVARTLSS